VFRVFVNNENKGTIASALIHFKDNDEDLGATSLFTSQFCAISQFERVEEGIYLVNRFGYQLNIYIIKLQKSIDY